MASLGTIAVVTALTTEPVTAADMREHCRIDHNADNTYLSALIIAARQHVENVTGKLLAAQTIRQRHDAFPCRARHIILQRSPVTSVTVTYYDTAGDVQTMEAEDLQVLLDGIIAIDRAPSTYWPSTEPGRLGAVTITIVGGYSTCPETLKVAVKMLAAHWYAVREAVTDKPMSEIPLTVKALLAPHISPLYL